MLRVGVFLAVCAVAYGHDPYGNRHYEEHEYPGRPLKLVDVSRLSHGYNEHDSIEEKIAKEVLSPVYVRPQNVIDYRYLKKGGRAYKLGFGGQINILPYKPTPGDYQHVFDHLLQELRHREIVEDRERGHYGNKKQESYIDTTPIRLFRPDHEVSPHYHEHKIQELKHEHEHKPREEFRPREDYKPVYELKKEPEHRPHNEHKLKIPQWPILAKVHEHKEREPVYNNWGAYEKREERPRYEIKPEEKPRHERPYEQEYRPRYEPRRNEHRPAEAHKPHHIPWVQ